LAILLGILAELVLDAVAFQLADSRMTARFAACVSTPHSANVAEDGGHPMQGAAAKSDPQPAEGTDWLDLYLEEIRPAFAVTPDAYRGWTSSPQAGRYINVEPSGRRRTWQPNDAASTSGDPLNVWMFGGSTLWGMGARDDQTIPSWVARQLSIDGRPVRVENFGQLAYVSTQEALALTMELRAGRVPDVVVLYDGANDALAALQVGKAGQPMARMAWYPTMYSRQDLMTQAAIVPHYGNLSLSLLTDFILVNALGADFLPADKIQPLAQATVDEYAANVELVRQLGRAYGFQVRVFWQPTLFSKQPHSPHEAAVAQTYLESMRKFFAATNAAVAVHPKLTAAAEFRDLSAVLNDQGETLFPDHCHLCEEGNRRIAQVIAAEIEPLLSPAGSSP